jgi:hypothetical protein
VTDIVDVILKHESSGRISAWLGEDQLCPASRNIQLDAALALKGLNTPHGVAIHFRLSDGRLVRASALWKLLADAQPRAPAPARKHAPPAANAHFGLSLQSARRA